jgi:hypothetical protein
MVKRSVIQFTVAKKPPPPKIQIAEYRNEVRIELNKSWSASFLASLRRVVANWSSKTRPTFKSQIIVTVTSGIIARIIPKEADRKKPIWKWIDKTGTKRHKIKAKKKGGRLFFRTGYQSKTGAKPARFGGPGKATGDIRTAQEVNHPGFPPREFTDTIAKDLDPLFKRDVRVGGRRGIRRAKSKGKRKR